MKIAYIWKTWKCPTTFGTFNADTLFRGSGNALFLSLWLDLLFVNETAKLPPLGHIQICSTWTSLHRATPPPGAGHVHYETRTVAEGRLVFDWNVFLFIAQLTIGNILISTREVKSRSTWILRNMTNTAKCEFMLTSEPPTFSFKFSWPDWSNKLNDPFY